MKRAFSSIAVAAIAAIAWAVGAPLTVLAQTTPAKPGALAQTKVEPGTANSAFTPMVIGPVVKVDETRVTGKVTAIDPAKRMLRIQGDKGRIVTMTVGPEVNNFQNLKVGDAVTMRYTQAVLLAIAKGGTSGNKYELGEIRTKIEADAARQAEPGGKPGMSAVKRVTTVANVFQIDRDHNVLTLRGTDGVPVEVLVPDQVLKMIKLDDQVVIGYREAMGVAIEPGAATAKR